MPAGLRVERGDAHQTVDAFLRLEESVGVLSADLDLRRFDAGFLSLEQVEHLDLEAVPLRPPGIHPHQHFGPVLGFRAARARVDGEQRIARVVGAAQHVLQLEGLELCGDAIGFLLE